MKKRHTTGRRGGGKALGSTKAPTSGVKMSHYQRMRAAGYKQVWVLDRENEAVAKEAARQILLLRDNPVEKEAMDFIERIQDASDWQ
ncbi:MAG: antitoxin MazE family protein [Alphaproteobacteria bacterium]|jgi:hypothetical protein|nr:antitoxin MazE family protein [Alphaproteobacteria bacterium]